MRKKKFKYSMREVFQSLDEASLASARLAALSQPPLANHHVPETQSPARKKTHTQSSEESTQSREHLRLRAQRPLPGQRRSCGGRLRYLHGCNSYVQTLGHVMLPFCTPGHVMLPGAFRSPESPAESKRDAYLGGQFMVPDPAKLWVRSQR